ncbi:MAG: hypothetical protein DHS20C21_05170 [Gemmatimonadota bacterium]|nr:MAG: hypothetical protein DHS20C21_05170 [Gemmatimonadota bacterium]
MRAESAAGEARRATSTSDKRSMESSQEDMDLLQGTLGRRRLQATGQARSALPVHLQWARYRAYAPSSAAPLSE